MKQEIIKLIYDYSVNRKYAVQEFYDTILIIFLKYQQIDNYLKSIIIDNNIEDLGIYNSKTKTIKINNIEVLNNSDNEIELLSLRDIDEFFLINIEVVITLLHELEHIHQNILIDNKVTTTYEKLIYYGLAFSNSKVLLNFFGTKYSKKELEYLYNLTYDYNPCERLADINSYKMINDIIFLEQSINRSIKRLLKYQYETTKTIGYRINNNIIESPSYLYFKKLNRLDIINSILSSSQENYTLEGTLKLGLTISPSELNNITTYHRTLKKRII